MQVNDLDSPDSPLTIATSSGYSPYPPPAVFFATINPKLRANLEANMPLMPSPCLFWPTFVRDDGRSSLQPDGRISGLVNGQQQAESSWQTRATGESQNTNLATPMELSPGDLSHASLLAEDAVASMITEEETASFNSFMTSAETSHGVSTSRFQQGRPSGIVGRSNVINNVPSPAFQANGVAMRIPISQSRPRMDGAGINSSNPSLSADFQTLLRNVEGGQLHQFIPVSDPARWELPFLQGWLMGQTHAGLHTALPVNSGLQVNSSIGHGTGTDLLTSHLLYTRNMEALLSSSNMTTTFNQSRGFGRSSSRHRSRSRTMGPMGFAEGASFLNAQNDETEPHSVPTGTESEIQTSLATVAAAELPCTVKLRIWPHDIRVPSAALNPDTCRLTIPHAVLCRFSCFVIMEVHYQFISCRLYELC